MPYFMRKERDKYCVFKGTSNDPGELVKCHASQDEASAHMRALAANVSHGKGIDTTIDKGLPLPATSGPAEWESMSVEDIMKAVGKEDELVTNPVTTDEQDKNKAAMTASHRESLPDSAFLFIEKGGKKDDENKTTPRKLRHLPYRTADGKLDLPRLRNAISRLSQSATGKVGGESWLTGDVRKRLLTRAQSLLKGSKDGDDEKSLDDQLIVYKSGDAYRWLAIANVAMWDREEERLTDKAYDDAIIAARQLGYGELDLVHVPDTDVGNCDLMIRMGAGEEARLIQGGPWYNDSRAVNARKSVQSDPDYWGTSIKFVYDPKQFIDGVYIGGIRIKKCTILPRSMAASHGTAIAILGGEQTMKELDQETKDALLKLGIDESKIEELAERSKSLPDEMNVKTKDETPSIIDEIKSLIARALGKKPEAPEQTAQPDVAEQSKTTETEVAPVETTQEPEVAKEVDVELPTITSETVKAIAETVALSLAPSIQQVVQPLAETLTSITQWQESIEKRLLEAEKDIETKVVEKLESQPPVVKVRTTELKQAETDEPVTAILDSPANQNTAEFVKAVTDIVSGALKNKLDLPEIKLS